MKPCTLSPSLPHPHMFTITHILTPGPVLISPPHPHSHLLSPTSSPPGLVLISPPHPHSYLLSHRPLPNENTAPGTTIFSAQVGVVDMEGFQSPTLMGGSPIDIMLPITTMRDSVRVSSEVITIVGQLLIVFRMQVFDKVFK